jgi:hypothetical protein
MDVNPLAISAEHALRLARVNWGALQAAAANPKNLPAQIDRDRSEELADFGRGTVHKTEAHLVRYASSHLGIKNGRLGANDLALLGNERTISSLMVYLREVQNAGPRPEVTYPAGQIESVVARLTMLLNSGYGVRVRKVAGDTIAAVGRQTADKPLALSCNEALNALNTSTPAGAATPTVAALPRSVSSQTQAFATIQ